MNRCDTKKIKVGNIFIGGTNHVVIQSMSTILPKEKEKCLAQINELKDAGCEMVRVAVKDKDDAKAIRYLKDNTDIPIVADIHFDYELGIEAIEAGADKIRFNPGNIGTDDKLKALLDKCIENNIPVRIGVNSGSIEKDLLDRSDLSNVEKCVMSLERYIKKSE